MLLNIEKSVEQDLEHAVEWLVNTDSGILKMLKDMAFEKTWGKGENTNNKHFLLFPQYFLPMRDRNHRLNNI